MTQSTQILQMNTILAQVFVIAARRAHTTINGLCGRGRQNACNLALAYALEYEQGGDGGGGGDKRKYGGIGCIVVIVDHRNVTLCTKGHYM